MEIDQQLLKSAIKFLGLMFMMCGGFIIAFNIIFLPVRAIFFSNLFSDFIPWILIFSIGYALNMISKAF